VAVVCLIPEVHNHASDVGALDDPTHKPCRPQQVSLGENRLDIWLAASSKHSVDVPKALWIKQSVLDVTRHYARVEALGEKTLEL